MVEAYNPQYIDPEYGHPYWDDKLFDKKHLQLRHDEYPPADDKDNPENDGNKLSRDLIELCGQTLKQLQRNS